MWFDAKLASGATSFSQAGYTFINKNGDFNTYLSEVPRNTGVVPLPAAGWMLIAGVGGLAAAGRRKKA